jgi:threonyl-tRNA synthetase
VHTRTAARLFGVRPHTQATLTTHPRCPLLPHTTAKREKTRLTQESGARVEAEAGAIHRIGGPFARAEEPSFLAARAAVYDEVMAAQRERLARKPRVPISITLPDGKVVAGVSWETTPLMVAEGISKGLAASVVVAKVAHHSRLGAEAADGAGMVNTGPDEEEGAAPAAAAAELWDLVRPLEGDCALELKKFDDKEGKMVFWHSSAHVLGECMECKFGAKLCIGPPTEDGFYYDAYMGDSCVGGSTRTLPPPLPSPPPLTPPPAPPLSPTPAPPTPPPAPSWTRTCP